MSVIRKGRFFRLPYNPVPLLVGPRIDGTENDHGGGLNEINDFPLGFAIALDVPLCCLDTVMSD